MTERVWWQLEDRPQKAEQLLQVEYGTPNVEPHILFRMLVAHFSNKHIKMHSFTCTGKGEKSLGYIAELQNLRKQHYTTQKDVG